MTSSLPSVISASGHVQAAESGSGASFTWIILGVLVLFWVFMIFQSRRRRQAQQQQRQEMAPGTRVMLTSGIIGTLVERTDEHMVVEVADGVRLTVVPGAIARSLPALDDETVSGQDATGDLDADLDREPGGGEDAPSDTDGAPASPQRPRTNGEGGESAIREGR